MSQFFTFPLASVKENQQVTLNSKSKVDLPLMRSLTVENSFGMIIKFQIKPNVPLNHIFYDGFSVVQTINR